MAGGGGPLSAQGGQGLAIPLLAHVPMKGFLIARTLTPNFPASALPELELRGTAATAVNRVRRTVKAGDRGQELFVRRRNIDRGKCDRHQGKWQREPPDYP